ncbi:MAG: glycosyl hydrolase family 8 [Anaerovoracaceae bacterium]
MKAGKTEKILKILAVVLAIGVIAGICLTVMQLRFAKSEKSGSAASGSGGSSGSGTELTDDTVIYPDKVSWFSKLPDISFTDTSGEKHTLSEFYGKPIVIMYWASWCDDCRQELPNLRKYINASKKYGDVTFLLINRTDGKKETKKSAERYFSGLKAGCAMYFDDGEKIYDRLGIKNIPTNIFLSSEGKVEAVVPKQITSESVFRAQLEKAVNGPAGGTESFVTAKMTDLNGGIHSEYRKNGDTSSTPVLSESQGLMMKYAAETGDRGLFDSAWKYTKKNLLIDGGLASWKLEDGKASDVNALLDDLRIYEALLEADEKWGSYDKAAEEYAKNIRKYCIDGTRYVDFHDFGSGQSAGSLSLQYIDLTAMKSLASWSIKGKLAYRNAAKILRNGKISSDFPLYYKYYSYGSRSYSRDDLNTAEAMMTLLHLSEAGELPDDTLSWVKKHVSGSGLMARYKTDGSVPDGYNYESTAVYAITAMIGKLEKDDDLVTSSIIRMERMRIDDTSKEYNGAFGSSDGTGTASFDQLEPLLAYAFCG